jgi:ring-1,2-phenylacetyl-CoA epoxidase subunit PaaC
MSLQQPLVQYLLMLADNALILGHRNSEWTGHGPILEQDIALSNIALDLIGQSRNVYQYAAELAADGSTEDSLAYLRDARAYRNCLLAEQPNGDWGHTITRQLFASAYQYYLYQALADANDLQISAIATKALKEVAYHLRWSGEWMIRLGDGTSESHQRMQTAVNNLWPYTAELFRPADYEQEAHEQLGIKPFAQLNSVFNKKIREVLQEATITVNEETWMQYGGKTGLHSEHLGYLLAEMQFLQRAYPGATW